MSDALQTNRHTHKQHGELISLLVPLTEGKYVKNDRTLVSLARDDDGGKSEQLVWNKTHHGPTVAVTPQSHILIRGRVALSTRISLQQLGNRVF